ncbi:hypothetical protein [Actinoplanes friuliensis]|uniref:Uncharacterized protein n=1 Tax=Actinoplanes friuliensis DSM 7358 TaxID=1246995 RepID=U5W1R3_9ACTN|nr:hypothetical protein [Actinoplanes friuliensis]AGZ43158.1 hypothetical protein AFR_24460 [Actinoplanes friuliensis DSM 7358]
MDGATAGTEPATISDTERAVYGSVTSLELRAFLDAWTTRRLGSPIEKVRFRAGRIDVVWGVELGDGRTVVIKTHRPPVDLDAARSPAKPSSCWPKQASLAQCRWPDRTRSKAGS